MNEVSFLLAVIAVWFGLSFVLSLALNGAPYWLLTVFIGIPQFVFQVARAAIRAAIRSPKA